MNLSRKGTLLPLLIENPLNSLPGVNALPGLTLSLVGTILNWAAKVFLTLPAPSLNASPLGRGLLDISLNNPPLLTSTLNPSTFPNKLVLGVVNVVSLGIGGVGIIVVIPLNLVVVIGGAVLNLVVILSETFSLNNNLVPNLEETLGAWSWICLCNCFSNCRCSCLVLCLVPNNSASLVPVLNFNISLSLNFWTGWTPVTNCVVIVVGLVVGFIIRLGVIIVEGIIGFGVVISKLPLAICPTLSGVTLLKSKLVPREELVVVSGSCLTAKPNEVSVPVLVNLEGLPNKVPSASVVLPLVTENISAANNFDSAKLNPLPCAIDKSPLDCFEISLAKLFTLICFPSFNNIPDSVNVISPILPSSLCPTNALFSNLLANLFKLALLNNWVILFSELAAPMNNFPLWTPATLTNVGFLNVLTSPVDIPVGTPTWNAAVPKANPGSCLTNLLTPGKPSPEIILLPVPKIPPPIEVIVSIGLSLVCPTNWAVWTAACPAPNTILSSNPESLLL